MDRYRAIIVSTRRRDDTEASAQNRMAVGTLHPKDGRRSQLVALRPTPVPDGQAPGSSGALADPTRRDLVDLLRARDGRFRRHYLNPVLIREIHDRWISLYGNPVGFLVGGVAAFDGG